jgi:hypothetical protein
VLHVTFKSVCIFWFQLERSLPPPFVVELTKHLIFSYTSSPRGLVVIIIAIGPKLRWFKPGRVRWVLVVLGGLVAIVFAIGIKVRGFKPD